MKRARDECNATDWKGKTALIVIDMQVDFCQPGKALCVAGAMGILPTVVEAVAVARTNKVPVFFVCREHDPSGASCPPSAAAQSPRPSSRVSKMGSGFPVACGPSARGGVGIAEPPSILRAYCGGERRGSETGQRDTSAPLEHAVLASLGLVLSTS
jgi:hypothetical protein